MHRFSVYGINYFTSSSPYTHFYSKYPNIYGNIAGRATYRATLDHIGPLHLYYSHGFPPPEEIANIVPNY